MLTFLNILKVDIQILMSNCQVVFFVFGMVLLSLIVLFLILFFGIGIFFYNTSLKRKDLTEYYANNGRGMDETVCLKNDKEFISAHKFDEVFIEANDGIKLAANVLKAKNMSHKYVIFFHGYRGTVLTEWSSLIHLFYDYGYNIYVVHERGNWDSGGKYFTMGPKEKDDLVAWVNYVASIDEKSEICLFGHSMGAHIVLLGLGEDLKSNVKCAIADCGYSDLDAQFLHTSKNMMHLRCSRLLVSIGELYCKVFYKMHFNETTSKALPRCKTPVCLIHGTADKFVPYSNLKINFDSIPKDIYKEQHTFVGAAHCSSESKDPKRFYKIVNNFISAFIK